MKNILLICPRGASPVRIYRGEGVLERLAKLDSDINIIFPSTDEIWKDLIKADLVYFMRTTTPGEIKVAEMAKAMGIPTWYDADDDYFNVTSDSPVFSAFQDKTVRESVAWFIQNADVMSVSTRDLKHKYQSLRSGNLIVNRSMKSEIFVIENALDDYAFDVQHVIDFNPQKRITWRGGATHQGDLLNFADQFWEFFDNTAVATASRKDEEWFAHFIGYYPFFIESGADWCPKDYSKRIMFSNYSMNYYTYLKSFREQSRPWAHVVPLTDNAFNHSKSNIAALEAIYAGAIPIVPDWEEWQFPGALRYSKREDCGKLMEKATRMTSNTRIDMFNENVKHIVDHTGESYLLSKVNEKRLSIVRSLVKK